MKPENCMNSNQYHKYITNTRKAAAALREARQAFRQGSQNMGKGDFLKAIEHFKNAIARCEAAKNATGGVMSAEVRKQHDVSAEALNLAKDLHRKASKPKPASKRGGAHAVKSGSMPAEQKVANAG